MSASDRWNTLTRDQQEGIPPLCPDFVLELRSPSDRLQDLQDKMSEYLNNGARLGWLIDPIDRVVHIYRPREVIALHLEGLQAEGLPIPESKTLCEYVEVAAS